MNPQFKYSFIAGRCLVINITTEIQLQLEFSLSSTGEQTVKILMNSRDSKIILPGSFIMASSLRTSISKSHSPPSKSKLIVNFYLDHFTAMPNILALTQFYQILHKTSIPLHISDFNQITMLLWKLENQLLSFLFLFIF